MKEQKKNGNITLEMLAEKLGISPGTVSLALNDKPGVSRHTRELVLKCASELKYRSFVTSKLTRQIGVIMPNITTSFNGEILAGIEKIATAQDYDVIVHSAQGKFSRGEQVIERLVNKVDGLIVFGGIIGGRVREILLESGLPIVVLAVEPDPDFPTVSVDYRKACEQVIDHFYELGHRDIVYAHGISRYSELRLQYSREAATKYGLKLRQCLVESEVAPEKAYFAFAKFMTMEHGFTAVACSSDFIAGGVLQALTDGGLKVPQDVSLVGFDGLSWTKLLMPPLNTIQQPRSEQGEAAMLLLGELMKDNRLDGHVLESVYLIRNSTAPCRTAGAK